MAENKMFNKKCVRCMREFTTKNRSMNYCSKRCEYPNKESFVKK